MIRECSDDLILPTFAFRAIANATTRGCLRTDNTVAEARRWSADYGKVAVTYELTIDTEAVRRTRRMNVTWILYHSFTIVRVGS